MVEFFSCLSSSGLVLCEWCNLNPTRMKNSDRVGIINQITYIHNTLNAQQHCQGLLTRGSFISHLYPCLSGKSIECYLHVKHIPAVIVGIPSSISPCQMAEKSYYQVFNTLTVINIWVSLLVLLKGRSFYNSRQCRMWLTWIS